MSDELSVLGQALVDALRACGVARLIVPFETDGESVEVGVAELYEQIDHGGGGFLIEPVEVDDEKQSVVSQATSELVAARYAGKAVTGRLLVDEEDRIWSEGVHEEDVAPKGLKVEL